jgi:putative restriction endonuclease
VAGKYGILRLMGDKRSVEHDLAVRIATFRWLDSQVERRGDVLDRRLLQAGFNFNGDRVPLVAPQGIFTPRLTRWPLTITTAPNSPYDDTFLDDGSLAYRYRGSDPNHRDNVGLREAMVRRLPLVYLHGVAPGRYGVIWPVFVVSDIQASLTFRVEADELHAIGPESAVLDEHSEARRGYITRAVRVRLHQRTFRERVLRAYRTQCSICRLRHAELLDAAHLVPDAEPAGEPTVSNGIALCRLHHSAFDALILGIDPDFKVHVREDVLLEQDGPTLRHGLQAIHGTVLQVPAAPVHQPNRDSLALRYARFRSAA